MTDDLSEEQGMPPDPEEDQPAGEDDEPEVSPNPRDTGAYRIDQILAQNLRGALDESKRRTGEVEEVDQPELEPEQAQQVVSWKAMTDTIGTAGKAEEVPVVDPADATALDAQEAALLQSLPDEDRPPLLHYDEVVRSSQTMKVAPVPEGSIWEKLRRWLRPTQEERMVKTEDRLGTLDEAIEDAPDVAVNYLARAELLLEIGRVVEAIDDFERVETLAAKDFEDRRWGVVAQAMRDRAQRGMEEAQKRL